MWFCRGFQKPYLFDNLIDSGKLQAEMESIENASTTLICTSFQ